MTLIAPPAGQFTDGRGLAGAIDADREHHERLVAADIQRFLDRLEQGDQRLAQCGQQGRGVGEFALVHALAQVLDQLGTGLDTDVGADQGGFQLVEQVVIELGVTHEQRGQAARERIAG